MWKFHNNKRCLTGLERQRLFWLSAVLVLIGILVTVLIPVAVLVIILILVRILVLIAVLILVLVIHVCILQMIFAVSSATIV